MHSDTSHPLTLNDSSTVQIEQSAFLYLIMFCVPQLDRTKCSVDEIRYLIVELMLH